MGRMRHPKMVKVSAMTCSLLSSFYSHDENTEYVIFVILHGENGQRGFMKCSAIRGENSGEILSENFRTKILSSYQIPVPVMRPLT